MTSARSSVVDRWFFGQILVSRCQQGTFSQFVHLTKCCTFGLTLTLTLKLTLTLTLTLTLLQVGCATDQILRNSSNAAQLIYWLAAQRIWSDAQLTKCALHTDWKTRKLTSKPIPNPMANTNPNLNYMRCQLALALTSLGVPKTSL